ncbi:MAG: hypothetical protein PUC88_04545 [Clostridia bacterium]|nr:hypothetical protein [Clostridia bacterium]
MRKFVSILILIACVSLLVSGCSGKDKKDGDFNLSAPTTDNSDSTVIDYDLTTIDKDAAYNKAVDITTNEESFIGKTIKLRGITSVITAGESTYYSMFVKNAEGNSTNIYFLPEKGTDKLPSEYDTCEITGVFGEINDAGIMGLSVKKEDFNNVTMSYAENVTNATENVTLENSLILDAYGVKLKFSGVESRCLNMFASNTSNQTIILRTYDAKINGEQANYTVYETIAPGEDVDISAYIGDEADIETLSMIFEIDDEFCAEIYTSNEITISIK